MKLPQAVRPIRHVPQIREYRGEPVPDDVIETLLELGRWTGSSRNLQPWHFIVVRDREHLRQIAALRPNIRWVADVPLGIVVVTDGAGHDYDEGRLTERILTGATMLGYGGGTAWFQPDNEAAIKKMLGIPADKATRQIIAIGRPKSKDDPRSDGPKRGRKPLADLVHRDRW